MFKSFIKSCNESRVDPYLKREKPGEWLAREKMMQFSSVFPRELPDR